MDLVFKLHSVVRYLVLAAGLIALVWFVGGALLRRNADKAVRVLGATFTGLLDLQVLLGAMLVLLGLRYPALVGHIAMMLLAAGAAHVLLVLNRRRARPGWLLPIAGVGIALALIVGGISAIGRSVLGATAFPG